MQKTSGFHRLLAVLVSVLLAVCCLPTSVFAAAGKVSPKIHLDYKLDGRSVKQEEIWPGEVAYTSGQKVKYSWDTLYEKMTLPDMTAIKGRQTGDCELDLFYKVDQNFHGYLTVELEPQTLIEFTIRYVGSNGAPLESHKESQLYSPSNAKDAWKYVTASDKFLGYQAALKELKVEEDGDKAYTGEDQLQIGPDLQGKTLVAYLDKSSAPPKKVDFTLRYLSTDNQIQDTQPATLTFGPDDAGTDVWNFVMAQDAYKTYAAQGYTLADYVVPGDGGDRLCDKVGMQTVNADLQDKTVIVHLVKPVVSKPEQVPFRLAFRSTDGNIADDKNVEVPYDANGNSYDLWSYIESTGAYKGYQAAGYTMKSFVVPHQDGNKTYTGAGQFTVTPNLRGAIVTVELDKPVVPTTRTVDFTVQYLSNDNLLNMTKQVSAQYDAEGVLTDLWDYLAGTGTVQTAQKDGYTVQDYMLDGRTVNKHGGQAVNGDLAGKTVTVHLYKEPVPTTKTVQFELRFLSTDNQIHETKAVSLTYDPAGELTDLWNFLLANEAYKNFTKEGYKLSDYVITRENGDLNGVARGIQAVTTDLEGKTVIVHLVKETAPQPENVEFSIRFLSTDGKIDETKAVSVPYDPNGKSYDAWNYLLGTGSFQRYAKEGYTLKDLVVHQAAGDVTYTRAGGYTVTPALKGATVLVHLDNTKTPARYESVYTVHFVDEKGKEFQPAATVKVSWTEGQQLNLVAQLQETLKTVGAKGYTFRTLSAWNSSAAYKGTELVVPGNWELAAHCTKNVAPAAPQKPAQTAKAKPAAAPAKTVVKPAAPAANNTKILPKTGLQLESPVVFGVMLFAALAGAAAYLIAVRKKLN